METKSKRRLGKKARQLTQLEVAFAAADVGYEAVIARQRRPSLTLTKRIDGVVATSESGEVEGASVQDVLNKLSRIEDATNNVARHGRSYNLQNDRIAVHLWSKDASALKVLKEVFGGNYYRHGSGFLWICSKRSQLQKVWEAIQPYLDEEAETRLRPLMLEFS